MNISFVGNPAKTVIRRFLPEWIDELTRQGHGVCLPAYLAAMLPEGTRRRAGAASEERALIDDCELLVSLGGDGTILHAAQLVGARNIPILGVKFGGLGFLADVAPEEFLHALDEVRQGLSPRQQRMVLEGRVIGKGAGANAPSFALNDFVVLGSERSQVSRINVWVDEDPVCTYIADGLIVSTPTGSTAYSMAAGGPLLIPRLDCCVITPICPHSLIARPLVIGGDAVVKIAPGGERDASLRVISDGREDGFLGENDALQVKRAAHTITILHRRERTFFDVLRMKLNWGDDIRQEDDGEKE